MIDEAAFAHELRGGERIETHQDPRPEAERPARTGAVGLALDRPPHFERNTSDGEGISLLELEALGERGIHERAPPPAGLRQRLGKRNGRAIAAPCLDAAEQGIPAVHRLELDEHAGLGARAARHGSHLRKVGDRLRGLLQASSIGRGEVLIDGTQGDVAPEDLPSVRAQPGDDRARRRLHPGDGGDPEREATEKDPEPAKRAGAVAQLSEREPKRYGWHGGDRGPDGATMRPGASVAGGSTLCASIRPSTMRMVRPQSPASRASWVIRTRVAPLSRLRAKRWSIT